MDHRLDPAKVLHLDVPDVLANGREVRQRRRIPERGPAVEAAVEPTTSWPAVTSMGVSTEPMYPR